MFGYVGRVIKFRVCVRWMVGVGCVWFECVRFKIFFSVVEVEVVVNMIDWLGCGMVGLGWRWWDVSVEVREMVVKE